jgi:hypothetical protein
MPILDHRRQVERRQQATVAQRPMLAAAKTRTRDADDCTEDDEEIRRDRGCPGEPRKASIHEAGM